MVPPSPDFSEISPRLPQELCDAIIDEVAKITKANFAWDCSARYAVLKRLSLVCRQWTPRAQFCLFCSVWLNNLQSLRKLETHLSLRNNLLPIIHELYIRFHDKMGYPVCNLLTAVTTLARKCSHLKALSLVDGESWSMGPSTPPHYYCIPFDPRSHPPLFRSSFNTITELSLSGIHYRSDTDLLAFLFSFIALKDLSLRDVRCKTYRRVKQKSYIILLKQRKGILDKLRCLTMVWWPIFRIRESHINMFLV